MTERKETPSSESVQHADDCCVLPLVRRLAALLDLDPQRWREGDPLPRGWHVMLFNEDTPQSRLRQDGAAGLGVTLPDTGLPRLMMGGKRTRYERDIAIGAAVRRTSRLGAIVPKEGRSGRFVIVTVRHDIHVDGAAEAAIVEEQDYIMREAAVDSGGPTAGDSPSAPLVPTTAATTVKRVVTPDEALLFRYSAITSNPHRIHYDHPYATQREGYPALVVNGGLPTLLLIELFKQLAERAPAFVKARNVAPLFCARPIALHAEQGSPWRLWAEDDAGRLAIEAEIE